MPSPVTGITPQIHALKPFGSSPNYRMGFLQNKDVFFSSQSYRAQLTRFFQQKPDRPIMFSFVPPEDESLWNRLPWSPERDVIVMTPLVPKEAQDQVTTGEAKERPKLHVEESTEDTEAFTLHNEASDSIQAESADNLVQVTDTIEPMAKAEDDSDHSDPLAIGFKPRNDRIHANPFASPPAPPEKPKKVDYSQTPLKVQRFSGQLVESHWFLQLDQAYKHLGLDRHFPSWVHQKEDKIHVLTEENPRQAGYQLLEHPWLSLLYRSIARIFGPLFGIKRDNTTIRLPNGSIIPLHITSWQNASGEKANLYRAVGLPDGRWLKLSTEPSEEVSAYKEQKTLRQSIESHINRLEQAGKVRETFGWLSAPPHPFSVPVSP